MINPNLRNRRAHEQFIIDQFNNELFRVANFYNVTVEHKLNDIWASNGKDFKEPLSVYITADLIDEFMREVNKEKFDQVKLHRLLKLWELAINMYLYMKPDLSPDVIDKLHKTLEFIKSYKKLCDESEVGPDEYRTTYVPESFGEILFFYDKDTDWRLVRPDSNYLRYYHKTNPEATLQRLEEFKKQGYGMGKRKARIYYAPYQETHRAEWSYMGLYELHDNITDADQACLWRKVK